MARAGERAQPQVVSVVMGTTTSADQQLMLISDVMWYCNGMERWGKYSRWSVSGRGGRIAVWDIPQF